MNFLTPQRSKEKGVFGPGQFCFKGSEANKKWGRSHVKRGSIPVRCVSLERVFVGGLHCRGPGRGAQRGCEIEGRGAGDRGSKVVSKISDRPPKKPIGIAPTRGPP